MVVCPRHSVFARDLVHHSGRQKLAQVIPEYSYVFAIVMLGTVADFYLPYRCVFLCPDQLCSRKIFSRRCYVRSSSSSSSSSMTKSLLLMMCTRWYTSPDLPRQHVRITMCHRLIVSKSRNHFSAAHLNTSITGASSQLCVLCSTMNHPPCYNCGLNHDPTANGFGAVNFWLLSPRTSIKYPWSSAIRFNPS